MGFLRRDEKQQRFDEAFVHGAGLWAKKKLGERKALPSHNHNPKNYIMLLHQPSRAIGIHCREYLRFRCFHPK